MTTQIIGSIVVSFSSLVAMGILIFVMLRSLSRVMDRFEESQRETLQEKNVERHEHAILFQEIGELKRIIAPDEPISDWHIGTEE